MKEIREFVEKYLWLAALVAGVLLVFGGIDNRSGIGIGMVVGGAILCSTSMVCVYFARSSDK